MNRVIGADKYGNFGGKRGKNFSKSMIAGVGRFSTPYNLKNVKEEDSDNADPLSLKKGRSAVSVLDINESQIPEFAESRHMDYHNKKFTEKLSPSKKNEVMDRYLTLKNKLGLNFFKPEIEGIK